METSRSLGAASLPSSPGLRGCIPTAGIQHLLPSLAPGEDLAPSRLQPGAHVRPRTVTPAWFGGFTCTPHVPNCLEPSKVSAKPESPVTHMGAAAGCTFDVYI